MTNTTGSHIGKSFFVSAALPATLDKAGFEALTWIEAKGIQILPQLGVTHNNIDVPDLKTGETKGIKGAASGKDSKASFRHVAGDTGQALIRTTADAGGDLGSMSIKIVKGSGVNNAPVAGDPVEYAQGYVHSYEEIQGEVTSHEGFSVSFKQNGKTIKDVEPA